MATVELWIQLENHPWDMSPRNTDRMMGHLTGAHPGIMEFHSPDGTIHYSHHGFNPLVKFGGNFPIIDALILRRYLPPEQADQSDAWTVPDDRKVNPWDLNERDPRDRDASGTVLEGTMGTIPGPTIECEVGDQVVVHFRNMDKRTAGDITPMDLVHSLHTHGFVFDARYDGAYPLSPLDPSQPIEGAELDAWKQVAPGLDQFKDPISGNLFKRGDRVPPGGTFTYIWETFGWPTTAGVWLYHDHSMSDVVNVQLGAIGVVVIHNVNDPEDIIVEVSDLPGGSFTGSPIPNPDQDPNGQQVIDTPAKAQYLLLFHTLNGNTCINGRLFLGNTPTLIAGLDTRMRFGVVGMGNASDGFHTFHIHGHRWIIPGPDGTTSTAIENSPQVRAVSQFEDTRVFGPASSFSFTINQGSFMGSLFKPDPTRASGLGEWHMHCHVLDHMQMGMMGSLLVVKKDQVLDLPTGVMSHAMVDRRRGLMQRTRGMQH